MLLIIITLIMIAGSFLIKYYFYKRAGYRNAKRFYYSLFKWYNHRNIWEVQGVKPRTFMKVSNVCNILLWSGMLFGIYIYMIHK